MSDVSHDHALQLMALPKMCSASLAWSERDNHVGLLLASAQPEDETGAILPGLTLQLEIKRPIVVDRCLYEFGLFMLEHGVRRRVYQLNVCPADKRSHNGPQGPMHGPHEHVGNRVLPVDDPDVACGRPDVAFAYYCRRINLAFSGALNSPL
jgi:hypothetical protein